MAPGLTRGSVSKLSSLRGLDGVSIPRTIADTISLLRKIGKRYLWVDCFCIIQDDDDDKQQHLPIMDSIYNQAGRVIIAATGSDAHAGLPGMNEPRRQVIQHNETISGVAFTTKLLAVKQKLEGSIWNT